MQKTMAEKPDKLLYEKLYLAKGYKYICGVDEVGRGPLAGPVTVAAVIMPFDGLLDGCEDAIVAGIDDSKKLSERKREKLFDEIMSRAAAVKICSLDNNEIDRINILNATKECMKAAIREISIKPDVILIDAVKLETGILTESIIKGDALSYSIGAASIVAKVTRDRLMREYDAVYPEYGFAKNKGYGAAVHIEAIKKHGATPIHRKTYLKNILAEQIGFDEIFG